MTKTHLISLGLVPALLLSASASADNRAIHPAKDDPALCSSFFFFVEDFSGWLEARAAAEPATQFALS